MPAYHERPTYQWRWVEITLGQNSIAYWFAPCSIAGCANGVEASERYPLQLIAFKRPLCEEHDR